MEVRNLGFSVAHQPIRIFQSRIGNLHLRNKIFASFFLFNVSSSITLNTLVRFLLQYFKIDMTNRMGSLFAKDAVYRFD